MEERVREHLARSQPYYYAPVKNGDGNAVNYVSTTPVPAPDPYDIKDKLRVRLTDFGVCALFRHLVCTSN